MAISDQHAKLIAELVRDYGVHGVVKALNEEVQHQCAHAFMDNPQAVIHRDAITLRCCEFQMRRNHPLR